MCFTQNIDTLERRAGVSADKIIEAHRSFATQRCIKCRTPSDNAKMKEMVLKFSEDKVVPRCEKKGCRGLVKPDIVFFSEAVSYSHCSVRSFLLLIHFSHTTTAPTRIQPIPKDHPERNRPVHRYWHVSLYTPSPHWHSYAQMNALERSSTLTSLETLGLETTMSYYSESATR
ncbi:hypothetical protein GYMLUDRAFT_408249 [Collybiopsis luxurians FD-317 M1]|uniref:Deacetylase sirtuin-type domain-containing protein n=1 Tax=Collybiopsis luxurians FD-317 M1 TaxID=944289 RepID=A0A0D0ALK7_9AGAR|nr:hypothetical protein GYMLUDRAFT_408249 [Collybiopsis luxurians FD-317 M1]